MDDIGREMTLDAANAGVARMTPAKALAVLSGFAKRDDGVLHIALADHAGFYRLDASRPAHDCDVWVMSGRQPITYHGAESNAAYSSACAMILGLKIAKAFSSADAPLQALNKPWLDDLSKVMLRAGSGEASAPGSIPLTEALYNTALQHGVDMTLFRVYDNCEEHF